MISKDQVEEQEARDQEFLEWQALYQAYSRAGVALAAAEYTPSTVFEREYWAASAAMGQKRTDNYST